MHHTRTPSGILLLITLLSLIDCLFASCQVNSKPSVLAQMSQVEDSHSKLVLILEKTADAIEKNYVFPEKGRQIATRLRAKTKAGSYN